MRTVELWVDGSAIRPGGQKGMVPGGWAAILRTWVGCANNSAADPWARRTLSGSDPATEANRMELTAVRNGLLALNAPCVVKVYTDSRNVIGWLSAGWKRKSPGIEALVMDILSICDNVGHSLLFEKVSGHSGVPLNEECDELAQAAARKVDAKA